MKPELILHIGQSKTGTSSIQTALGARREQLLEQGVFYPASAGTIGHLLLPASLVAEDQLDQRFHPSVWEGVSPALRLERFRTAFPEELRNLPATVRKVVISSEYCVALLKSAEAIKRLAATLKPYFDSWRVVIYLRRQDLHIASVYNEQIRVGDLSEPAARLAALKHAPSYHYDKLLDAWASAFGQESMVVRIYERDLLRNGDVLDDFLDICGTELDIAPDHPHRRQNQSIDLIGQQLLTRIGRRLENLQGEVPAGAWLWRRIGHHCSRTRPGRGWRPTQAQTRDLIAYFGPGNESVRRRFFPERDTLFTDDSESAPRDPILMDADVLLAAAVDVLIYAMEREGREQSIEALVQARLHRSLGDREATQKSLLRGVWTDPSCLPARLALADDYLREGAFDAAREQIAAAKTLAAGKADTSEIGERIARMERRANQGKTTTKPAEQAKVKRSPPPRVGADSTRAPAGAEGKPRSSEGAFDARKPDGLRGLDGEW